jgi:hypothetical protein
LARGHPNVVQVLTAFPLPKAGFVIVFPVVEHDDFSRMLETFTLRDVRGYMLSLFRALEHVHAQVRHGGVSCRVVRCRVVSCGVVWCGVVWCGAVWCGVVWCGVVWCGVVWCGVVWWVLSCAAPCSPT